MSEGSKFDELLTQLGTGRWNLLHFMGAAFLYILIPSQAFSVVYLAPAVNYTCQPHLDHNVSSISEDSCKYERWTSDGLVEEEPCTEWDFDTSIYTNTLTSEFNLVCSRGYLRATYHSIFMSSSIIGLLVSGYTADRYGRKVVVVVFQSLSAITCISIAMATNFSAILALRFVLGSLSTPTFYMLGIEVCQVKHRSIVGILMGLPWALGMMLTGVVAYFIRDWSYFQLAVSIPTLLIFPILYLINESPRWLIVQGRHKDALKVLRRAARLNRVTLPPDQVLLPMMRDIQSENASIKRQKDMKEVKSEKSCCSLSTHKLVKTAKMRLIISVFSLIMFISSMVYCGLNLSGSAYSSNPFLYIVLSGLMEVPGYTITSTFIRRWGRKYPTMIGYAVCGGVILSISFIPSHIKWLVMTFAMVGKLAISGAFMILFVYEAELIPTEVRLQGMAMITIAGQIAATIAPYIVDYLVPLVPWLPSVMFGVLSFVASLALIPLPETKDKDLPDTIGDLELFWRNKKTDDTGSEDSQLKELTA